ncbi:hypothetical protein BCR42DRAFT_335307 [Absidia repens]|uniref:Polynucleotide 5'-hydroxyl-kinase GRC3 n=1 Tax=Absidia repens TaxID=90262 RepID=A0A1X2I444_9FUNG|nr:hypothetical protein BCR42DRAFT_335307 [Absidia repens]
MSQYVSFFPTFSSRASGLTVIQSTCYEKVATRAPSVTMNSTFDNLTELLGAFDERWERFESIVVVKSLDWCGVDQLEQVMPSLKNQFRLGTKHAYVINDGPFYDDITGFQPIINVTPEVKALQNQSSWQISVDRIISYEQAPSISVICGNINVNKSAFARYTINRLLKIHQRVAYLETDVGQTEFTPAGLVSLHVVETPVLGPSFTHPHLKCRQSFFIGTTSARMDPTYYQQCIKQLLSKYRQESEEWTKIAHQDQDGSFLLPLVVNTHGWTSGLGYDILLSLMENAKPTHVFGLMSLAASGYGLEKNFPDDFAHKVMMFLPPHLPVKQQLMFLTAPTPTSELLEHHQHRQLMFLSYIYHNPQVFCRRRQDTTTCSSSWWQVAPPLIHRTPWTADWHEQIHGVWVLYDDVPLSQLLYVLKGAIVALIGEIVPERHQFHVFTPLPTDRLGQVTRIVKGDLELPVFCMLDQSLTGTYQDCGEY